MEDEGKVFSLDAGRQFDTKKSTAVVQGNHEESSSCENGRSLRVELSEVLLGPLVNAFRVDSTLGSKEDHALSLLFRHFYKLFKNQPNLY